MKHEIDLKNYKIRSDLIVDSLSKYKDSNIQTEERKYGEIEVSDVVMDQDTSKVIGKKEGKYITMHFKDVTDRHNREALVNALVTEIREMLHFCQVAETSKVLVVGLGNGSSTPDALGPKVVEQIYVTKYLFDLGDIQVEPGIRNVSAFSPGVMGTTGMESSDIILGIVEKTKPDFLIIVDALASSSVERVNTTIQMTDTGIHPGSGVGNARREISKETIGIPVLAIGIPTVVDAVTIVSDTIEYLLKQMSYNKQNYNKGTHKFTSVTARNYLHHEEDLSKQEKENLLGMVGGLENEEVKSLIFEVLTPIGYNMMVTPKEVDFVIDHLSEVVSKSLNIALHQKDLSN